MSKLTRSELASLFETGDQPTGSDFLDLIDSALNLSDTTAQSMASDLTINGLLTATTVDAEVGRFSRLEADVTYQLGIESIADLKTVTSAADGTFVVVKGYRYAGDRGGGVFYYDADASAADDYGTVIQPDDGVGRWLRVYEEPLNICWFGAVADCSTDSTQAVRNAMSVAGSIYLPTGPYLITDTVTAEGYARFKLSGPGVLHYQQETWPTSADKNIVLVSGCDYVDIDGIGVNASLSGWNGSRDYGLIGIKVVGADTSRIRNCNLADINGTGIYTDARLNVIGGNTVTSCAAFNASLSSSGDGIACVPSTTMRGGLITANTVRTSEAKRGRYGIYLGGNSTGPEISDNDIAGYEYCIFCSGMSDADIMNNLAEKTNSPLTLNNSTYINIYGNGLTADATVTAASTAEGLTLVNSQYINIATNRITGVSGNAFRSDRDSSFILDSNAVFGRIDINSGTYSEYMLFLNNVFKSNTEVVCTANIVGSTPTAVIDRMEFRGNTFKNSQPYIQTTKNIAFKDNVFDFSSLDYGCLRISNCFDTVLEDNVFVCSTVVGATADPVTTFKALGRGKASGNKVITPNSLTLTSSGNDAYNAFVVERPNIVEHPTTWQQKPITFTSKYSASRCPKVVYASAGSVPHGYYDKGDKVCYVDAGTGATAEDVCITSGWVGVTANASSTYWEGEVIYGVSGVYYVIENGVLGSTAFTTAGGVFDVGGCTLSYAAASATAVFKYAAVLS